jgi:hypothetical protein
MNSLPTGSIQSLLIMAASALSPVIALSVGFAGTDWWLRRRLNEKRNPTPLKDAEGNEVGRRGAATGLARLLHQRHQLNPCYFSDSATIGDRLPGGTGCPCGRQAQGSRAAGEGGKS